MPPGSRPERLQFQRRSSTPDSAGNYEGDFANLVMIWGEVRPIRGYERVLAGDLVSVQPLLIRVRQSSITRGITVNDRISRTTGEILNIRAIVDPDGRRAWLEMTADSGGAP